MKVYDTLPDDLKDRLGGKSCMHLYDFKGAYADFQDPETATPGSPRANHPMIYTDPDTGDQAIWVNRLTTIRVNELPPAESKALIAEVRSYLNNDACIYRHRWQPGDLLIWNNRLLQHAREPFDDAACGVIEELRPKVVSFHFGLPEAPLLRRVKEAGILVLSSATTAEEARWLEGLGCDAIIAQGNEAGGHRGMFLVDDIARQAGWTRGEADEADPDAFWADLGEVRSRTEEQWREEIAGPRIHLQARAGETVLGGIALLPEGYTPEHPIPEDRSHIVSLWVRPAARSLRCCRPVTYRWARHIRPRWMSSWTSYDTWPPSTTSRQRALVSNRPSSTY